MMQCLVNIVGVSKDECPCITDGLSVAEKAAIKLSTSKLFLDQLPGGIHLSACEYVDACKTLAQMALTEIENAALTLEHDLIANLYAKYKQAKPNFKGQVGRQSWTQNLAVNGRYQGMRLRPIDFSDGVITLTRITTIMNITASFKVYIYRAKVGSDYGENIYEIPVTSTAATYTTTDFAPIKLPLKKDGQSVEYYLIYDRVEGGGVVPKDNDRYCSTCNTTDSHVKRFLEVNGVQYNDLTDFRNTTADYYAHGLILDLSVRCDSEQFFCREYDANEAIAVVMARCVWYKAGENLIEAVLKSPEINRYTTMSREYLLGKRNHFRKEYEDRVNNFLTESIDVFGSGCFICAEQTNTPFVSGIYS